MDLNELQQRIGNFITVMGSWVLNVGKLYFSGTPENVTVDMIDANGNLTTTTLPNVAQFRKTVWDDVGGALGQLNKTFFIDNINGDDSNSGIQSLPFKTIAKAVSLTPTVGVLNLYLLRGQTYEIGGDVETSGISISDKRVIVRGYGDDTNGTFTLTWKTIISGTSNHLKNQISLTNSLLIFSEGNIELPAKVDVDAGWTPYSAIIGSAGICSVELFSTTLKLFGGSTFFRDGGWGSAGASMLTLRAYYASKTIVDIDYKNKAMALQFATGSLSMNGSLVYGDDTSASNNDLVAGIVKDSNGVIQNIISNKIL